MEDQLVKRFYSRFIMGGGLALIFFALGIFLAVNSILSYMVRGVNIYWLIFGEPITRLLLIFSGYKSLQYILDLSRLIRKKFKKITGEVIRKKMGGGDGGTDGVLYYLVKDLETGKKLKLKEVTEVDLVLGSRFTFLYLPHTKLAVVEEDVLKNWKS